MGEGGLYSFFMEIALFSAKEKGRMKKLSFFHTSFLYI